ncbi:MAG TPA: alpha/beta hydrolase [Pyrinomonadaceae bacterium]|nr:alpha/beta hydrolase [Pyrinomonadaceae bacterium]
MNKTLKKLLSGDLRLKRLMRTVLLFPFLIYLGFLIYAYFFSERLIFQPQPASYRDDGAGIVKLISSNGAKISARFYENPDAAHTILFSHGNAEDIGIADYTAREFRKNGFAVLVYDYQGYGTSEGAASEENSYRDVDAAYDHLTSERKIPPEKIIVYGRSLGGAVAIDLASRRKVGGLIAESTFVTAFRVLTKIPIFPFDKFQNIKKIKNVKCPVLFVHGRKDTLIPFRHAEKLFAEANEPKFSFWIDEAGHNDVFSVGAESYLRKIRDFADNLPK